MRLPAIGIRPRILVLGAFTLFLLTLLVWGGYRRGVEVLGESAEEAIRGQAAAIAAELDRGTLEALTAARGMALAAAQGLAEDDASLGNLARAVLDGQPRFAATWYVLEPEQGSAATTTRVLGWNRDPLNPGTINATPGGRRHRAPRSMPVGTAAAGSWPRRMSAPMSESSQSPTKTAAAKSSTTLGRSSLPGDSMDLPA